MRKFFTCIFIFLSFFMITSCDEKTQIEETVTPPVTEEVTPTPDTPPVTETPGVVTPTPTPEVITYDISFENNGFGSAPSTIEYVTEIPQLPILSNEGYNFLGWYSDEALTNPVAEGDTLTNDLKLYAKWEKVTYD